MRRSITGFGLAMFAVAFLALMCAEAAKPRTLRGKVLSSTGEAIKGAVVQVKNARSLRVRSSISEADGGYRFVSLDPDVDYDVFARYQGVTSPTKTISQFDSNEVVELDLVIPR